MKLGKLITLFFIGLGIVLIVSFFIVIMYPEQVVKFGEKVGGIRTN